jgi:hypothetical protein
VDGDGDGKTETAGEFGNGRINNADVVRQFRISLLPELAPATTSDLYSAMDVVGFVAPPCGGDGVVLNNDVVTCFRRSFGTETNYERLRDDRGDCTERPTTVQVSAVVAQEAHEARRRWVLGMVVGRVASPVRRGRPVRVPVRLKVAPGVDVATLQFAVAVAARGTAAAIEEAPHFSPARRQPAPSVALRDGTKLLLGWLEPVPGSGRGGRNVGTLVFPMPAGAREGDEYEVRFEAVSGASLAGEEIALGGRDEHVRVGVAR